MRRPSPLAHAASGGSSPALAASVSGSPKHAWRRGWPLVLELGVLALAVWAANHVINLSVYGARVPNEDVREYRRYAQAFWLQAPLFHHLPVEYPPLSIIPFTLSLLPPAPDVMAVFMIWMGLLFAAGYFWLQRVAGRSRALTYAVYLLVGAAATVFARYDLVPALVTLLALFCLERKRFGWSYVLLGMGVLLKLYPIFLVPAVAIVQWQHLRLADTTVCPAASAPLAAGPSAPTQPPGPLVKRLRIQWFSADRAALRSVARGVAICALVIGGGFGLAALLSGAGALSGFGYAGSRPLQIESMPATLLWFGRLFGLPAHDVYTFHSLNLVGPLDALLEPLSALALAAGCLLVYWRQLRGHLSGGQAFVATLCVVLVANKIFSPQYLIWVVPLVAYVVGFDLLWLAVCLLTLAIYPFLYFAHPHILLVAADWRFLPTIALRNILLLVVAVRAVLGRPAWDVAAARATVEHGVALVRRLRHAAGGPPGAIRPLGP